LEEKRARTELFGERERRVLVLGVARQAWLKDNFSPAFSTFC